MNIIPLKHQSCFQTILLQARLTASGVQFFHEIEIRVTIFRRISGTISLGHGKNSSKNISGVSPKKKSMTLIEIKSSVIS